MHDDPRLSRVAPETPVADLPEALRYYDEVLGFRTVMMMPEGDYAVVQRDGVAVHLFQADAEATPISFHIFAQGLDALFTEFEGNGAFLKQGVARQPWGNRDFRITDPFGNEIKFTEPLSS